MANNHYIDLYSGSEIEVFRIKDLLEQENIPSVIQNDFNSGNMAGFLGGTLSTVRLKVRESDFERSRSLIEDQQK